MSNDPILPRGWDWPEGVKPGCLPRKTAFGCCKGIPAFRDVIEVIPEKDWPDLVGTISLKPHVKTILDQDGEGSCATESTTGGNMVCRSWAGLEHVVLNPWFIYYFTKVRGGGSEIDTNLAFILEHGVSPQSVWPRSKGVTKPSEAAMEAALAYRGVEAFDIENKAEAGTALWKGFPLVYGRQGHSILGVEMTSVSRFDSAGSWGTRGAGGTVNGYHLGETLNGINWAYGAFALRAVTLTEL